MVHRLSLNQKKKIDEKVTTLRFCILDMILSENEHDIS